MTAEPGDRPPRDRLARAPSARYAPPAGAAAAARAPVDGRARARALGPAIGAAIVTAGLLVLVGGVLAEVQGLIAIAGLGGAGIGLLAARAAVPSDAGPAAMARAQVERAAVLLAVGTVVGSWVLTWAYGRVEGGVLGPLDYLWTAFGFGLVVQLFVGLLAAAWGASSGPLRGS